MCSWSSPRAIRAICAASRWRPSPGALHTFAQSRGVLVVELAQLSRPERGAWRAPDMHDLKETGQFEQDADLIVMIYRPDPEAELLAGEVPRHSDRQKQGGAARQGRVRL